MHDKDRTTLRGGSKVLFVSSSGGHLLELLTLHNRWLERHLDAHASRHHHWVCFQSPDAESLLKGKSVTWAFSPTNRHIPNLWRNWRLASSVIKDFGPDVVVSTGAGIAVPFLLAARRRGITTVYLESIARVEELSLSGRLLYARTDKFLVQWPELAARLDKAEFVGQIQ